jgi:hypothetical protein
MDIECRDGSFEYTLHLEKVFLGACFGVGLCRRGPNDNHIVVKFLCEDDGNWGISTSGFSSSWLPEIAQLVGEAHEWVAKNCLPDMSDGIQFGWKFREHHD